MKKIFISHSSLDKEVVDAFIDKILILGLNIETKDIACTSREDTGVKTGDDIRNFIKENISTCDFVFFMISENFQNSQICLNEMGAAWATDRNVKPLVFPNISFDSIGWLYNVRKGVKLDDSSALDSLFEDISEKYNTKIKVTTWNKQKNEFVSFIKSALNEERTQSLPLTISEEEEIDLLDCRERFDEYMEMYNNCLRRLTVAQIDFSTVTEKNSKKLSNALNLSPKQIRPILQKQAYDNDKLINSLEAEFATLEDTFNKAMEAGIALKSFNEFNDENAEEDSLALKKLIESMNEGVETLTNLKITIESDKSKLDKTYTASQNRLSKCLSMLISIFETNINKANAFYIHI